MPVPRSLMREYVTLYFNDVVGLTYYHDAGDSLGRTRMVLRLKKGVERWCEDTIGYTPWLQAYLNRKKKSVYLRFKSKTACCFSYGLLITSCQRRSISSRSGMS